jgi:Zn-finger nucleic acid-binding protein
VNAPEGDAVKCPLCDVDLQMTERQSIEIDYCPKCRGVWLDRGELDKIIERANAESPAARESREPAPRRDEHHSHDDHKHHDHKHDDYKHKKKKSPTSMIGDLFDF